MASILEHRNTALATNTAPQALVTISLVLRGISRVKGKVDFGADDFFAVVGVLVFWAYAGVNIWTILQYTARPLKATGKQILDRLFLDIYIITLLTTTAITAAKLSILFLYKRIFWPMPYLKLSINTLIAVSVVWWIMLFFMGVARCSPVSAAWSPSLPPGAHCMSLETIFLAFEIVNCLTEIAMIIVPLYAVRQLQISRRLKTSISFIFAAGFLYVCLTQARLIEGLMFFQRRHCVHSPHGRSVCAIQRV